jgi:hypothetical protein
MFQQAMIDYQRAIVVFNDGGLYAGSNPNVLMVVYPLIRGSLSRRSGSHYRHH